MFLKYIEIVLVVIVVIAEAIWNRPQPLETAPSKPSFAARPMFCLTPPWATRGRISIFARQPEQATPLLSPGKMKLVVPSKLVNFSSGYSQPLKDISMRHALGKRSERGTVDGRNPAPVGTSHH